MFSPLALEYVSETLPVVGFLPTFNRPSYNRPMVSAMLAFDFESLTVYVWRMEVPDLTRMSDSEPIGVRQRHTQVNTLQLIDRRFSEMIKFVQPSRCCKDVGVGASLHLGFCPTTPTQ